MLVDKSITTIATGKITCLKLITGEEVIAKVVSADAREIVVSDPLFLASTPEGPAFAPILQLIAEGTNPTIYMRLIGMHYTPHENVLNAYEEATSTIIMPKKSGIIT